MLTVLLKTACTKLLDAHASNIRIKDNGPGPPAYIAADGFINLSAQFPCIEYFFQIVTFFKLNVLAAQ